MKNFIITFVVMLLSNLAISQSIDFNQFKNNGNYDFRNTVLKIKQKDVFTVYKNQFNLSADDEMKPMFTTIEEGHFRTKFQQFYKGIKVEYGMMNVIGQNEIVLAVNGELILNLNLDISNLKSESEAITIAKNKIGAESYIGDNPVQLIDNEEFTNADIAFNYSIPIEKTILKINNGSISNYKICYRLTIGTTKPVGSFEVLINAQNGELLSINNEPSDNWNPSTSGTGWSLYDGSYSNLKTGKCDVCSRWVTRDVNNTSTKLVTTGFNGGTIAFKKDNNNNWVENSCKPIANAHLCGINAREFYLQKHGRWGVDYIGRPLFLITEASDFFSSSAAYTLNFPNDGEIGDHILIKNNSTSIPIPSAGNSGIGFSFATLDIIGHEYSHGFLNFTVNCLPYGEHRAIEEGLCDIEGIAAERFFKGSSDFIIGEDAADPRNFDNPDLDFINGVANPSPSIYQGNHWKFTPWTVSNPPPPGVKELTGHSNSGVIRKWFKLLADGGTFNGQTVQGIGFDKAEAIVYISYNWWLWSSGTFQNLADQSISAAIYHFGVCSQERRSVTAAWAAVGISSTLPNPCRIGKPNPKIVGPDVILNSDVYSQFAIQASEGETISDINWHKPTTWNTTFESGNMLLNSTTNFETQNISVDFKINDEQFRLSKIVKFSDTKTVGINSQNSNRQSNPISRFNLSKSNDLVIFPNPSNNSINVLLPLENNVDYTKLYLLDLTGKIIFEKTISSNIESVDVSNFQKGLYIIKVSNGIESKLNKIIVN